MHVGGGPLYRCGASCGSVRQFAKVDVGCEPSVQSMPMPVATTRATTSALIATATTGRMPRVDWGAAGWVVVTRRLDTGTNDSRRSLTTRTSPEVEFADLGHALPEQDLSHLAEAFGHGRDEQLVGRGAVLRTGAHAGVIESPPHHRRR